MSTLYADRGFVSVNGVPVVDVQSISVKQNKNAKAVPSMTRNRFNKGFVQGNTDIDITLSVAVQNALARAKLESLPYDQADIQLTLEVGSELYVCSGLFMKDVDESAGGIGDEVKTTFNMGALVITDAIGNSALFPTTL